MQLVLYANTDGRGFFNKAAADDSDRSLIEYLRGMVNIGENNESQYLRNKKFLQYDRAGIYRNGKPAESVRRGCI